MTKKQNPFTPDLSSKRVLIVEDDEANILLLEEVLKKTHIQTYFARDGKTAVDALEFFDADAVLMDIRLPELNGLEATKLIKKRNPDIKIIAQTAYAALTDKESCYRAGCDDYLSKPFSPSVLVEKLKNNLNQ